MAAAAAGVDAEEFGEDICAADDGSKSSEEEAYFDTVVGFLQEIVMGAEFQTMRDDFLARHHAQFEDTEENKFIYTEIFHKWTALIEGYLERALHERMPAFDMAKFMAVLSSRKDQIDSELLDMLSSLGEFLAFKEMVLAYSKAQVEDLASFGLSVRAVGKR